MKKVSLNMKRRIILIAAMAFAVISMDTAVAATKAATFLKTVEGFRPTEYRDSTGKRTIGYGFTSAGMLGKRRISEAEASVELVRICRALSLKLQAELAGQRLTDAERSALISLIYNIGWSNFKTSKMCRLLKNGKRGKVVADEFARWVYVTKDGQKIVCHGLKARRAKERQRFMGC